MPEYSRPLGDTIKRARGKLGLTQNEVADAADIDVRTVLNIENYKGNPKMEILYPLVRVLKIDAREIFNNRKCAERRPHFVSLKIADRGLQRRKKLLLSFRFFKLYFLPCATKTQHLLNETEPVSPYLKNGEAGSALFCVWLICSIPFSVGTTSPPEFLSYT